ncbi:hypothetical protein [Lentzea sp. NBRC 102530]|uniref:hypothetical protein n=1 Tax=Lentzea sp. NBRC 102530 TaxID=3032201 RepID=UPI00255696B7|nr:hypothetical protein [Lentzea sp. NBRC 102530]
MKQETHSHPTGEKPLLRHRREHSRNASQMEKVNFSMRMICSLATVMKVAAVCLFVGFMVGSVFIATVI